MKNNLSNGEQNSLGEGLESPRPALEDRQLPTIEEMSGLVHDFTNGKTLKEYMEELSDEW